MALGKYATFCAVLWTTLFSQHFGSASECGLSTHTLTIDEQERTYHTYIPIQVCLAPLHLVLCAVLCSVECWMGLGSWIRHKLPILQQQVVLKRWWGLRYLGTTPCDTLAAAGRMQPEALF